MQLTTNTRAFIESEQYSKFILLNLHDGLLPESFWRNVTDFGSGENLHIKTVGTVTLQEGAEDTPLIYNPIESGEIIFRINEYVGDAWYITDELREDGAQIDTLMAQRAAESTRAIQEKYESDYLKAAAEVYALADPYAINGFAHKIVSKEANGTLQLEDIIAMRLAFDKANVPAEGRVLIVDPIADATLNGFITLTSNITQFAVDILEQGVARGQQFRFNLYGFDILTSNRLHKAPSASDGTTTLAPAGGVVYNLAMCIADDQTKPLIGAWRRHPKAESERNKDRARDEFVVRARYGWGIQRMDTLGTIVTSASNYKPAA